MSANDVQHEGGIASQNQPEKPAGRGPHSHKRWLWYVFGAALTLPLALYLLALALLYTFQARLIFPSPPPSNRTPEDAGFVTYRHVTLNVDSETSEAWLLPAENARGTVLFSHGNGETMAERLNLAKALHDLGFNVLLYEYGGYARSTGSCSESRCYADARAAWRYLIDVVGEEPSRIVIFGESMGSGPSVDVAAELNPGALVLLSPFTSLADIIRPMLPYVPVSLVLKHRFDNLAKIGSVRCPVLILHGRDDTTVPFRHGRQLFHAANQPKAFVELPDGHGAFYAAPDKFKTAVDDFLTPYFPRGVESVVESADVMLKVKAASDA
ncbi:MAG: hypothetical protein AMXMBFR4_11500 [Candidatus Hydrogenedentota bacterium]